MTIKEMFGKQEPLCAELQRHLFVDEVLGPCIKHPLLFSVPHVEPLNAMCNKRLEFIKDRVAAAKLEGKFAEFIMFHERPYRCSARCGSTARTSGSTSTGCGTRCCPTGRAWKTS